MVPGLSKEMLYDIATPGCFGTAIDHKYFYHRHIRYIDDALMDMVDGSGPPLLIVEMPPRHGKTQLIGKFLPTWFLGNWPDKQVLFASATGDLAEECGYKAMQLYSDFGPQYFGHTLAQNRRSVKDWKTDAGGGMRCAGIGGDLTGRDGDLLIVDDYMRSPKDAISPTTREKQWDWFHSVFLARIMPNAMIVVMGTRWWKDDLIGRIISGEFPFPYRRIRLPAIAEDDDPLGRSVGEALWPEMWPIGLPDQNVENAWGKRVPGLAARRSWMPKHWWLAQYQQRPSTHGRTMFPEEYFDEDTIWTPKFSHPDEPDKMLDKWPHAFERSVIALDASMGKSAEIHKGDYSAIVFAGLSGGKIHIMADIKRRPPSQIVEDVIRAYRGIGADSVAIEANAFQALFHDLMDIRCREMEIPPLPIIEINHGSNASKETRVSRLGPYLHNKQLVFRQVGDCPLLVDQLKEFPLGEFKDGPDALEMAITALQYAGQMEEPDPMDHVLEFARI